MNPPGTLLGMLYDALMRFLSVSSGKARKVKTDLFQREGFLRFFTIFFAPRKVLINGVLEVQLCFLDRFSLEDDEIVGISDPTVKHIFCFIELKMAHKSFIFNHILNFWKEFGDSGGGARPSDSLDNSSLLVAPCCSFRKQNTKALDLEQGEFYTRVP